MPFRLHAPLALVTLLALANAQQRFVAGEILVGPAALGQARAVAHLEAQGLHIAQTDALSGVMRVLVPAGSEAAWIDRLGAHGDIEYAERNGIGSGGYVPNDTHFPVQWQLRNTGQSGGTPGADIRATDAWDVTTGSASTVIAVLDTGIDTDHPEFAGRIDPNGYDFVNNDPDPEADHPHGSRVSGVMMANADNNFGVAGVDWHCKVLPIKVLDATNAGTTFNLVQGINYCANQPQVQVISMSLINYPAASALANALQAARNAGKILLACAGNGGIGNANVSWPGASPETISIGATTRFDRRAAFSGTGSALDFVAPGANVVTVVHGSSSNNWASVSGCSFATPITAGIVGLLLAHAGQINVPPLDQQTVYNLLVVGAVDQVGPASEDTPGRDDFFGHGRLDARTALDALTNLMNCNNGDVGAGLGGPYDVLFVNGLARIGLQRRIVVPANIAFQISVGVPPSNPQPSPIAPFFILWAAFGDQNSFTPYQLPQNIGELCFDPTMAPTFISLASVAPFSTTVPPLPAGFVASIQGAIFDTPQADIGITNLVTWDVQTAPPPIIQSVLPGAAVAGTTINVQGSGFLPGLVLRVDSVVTPTISVAEDLVTFGAPANVTCNATLSITNLDNQSATAPYNADPVITNVVPIGGTPAAGGTQLILTGQNFVPGSTVTIGGNPMTIVTTTSVSILGVLPPGQPGPAAIVVTTPFGCTGTSSLTYM